MLHFERPKCRHCGQLLDVVVDPRTGTRTANACTKSGEPRPLPSFTPFPQLFPPHVRFDVEVVEHAIMPLWNDGGDTEPFDIN